jgi:hypothetical protein
MFRFLQSDGSVGRRLSQAGVRRTIDCVVRSVNPVTGAATNEPSEPFLVNAPGPDAATAREVWTLKKKMAKTTASLRAPQWENRSFIAKTIKMEFFYRKLFTPPTSDIG